MSSNFPKKVSKEHITSEFRNLSVNFPGLENREYGRGESLRWPRDNF
jgi:hypothetical protein